jgi:hypothetical protein
MSRVAIDTVVTTSRSHNGGCNQNCESVIHIYFFEFY